MLRVRRTLGLGLKREVKRLRQRGVSPISDPDEGLASIECDGACNARNVGFFLTAMDGGGVATAKSSSRLTSVEFTFSLSSTSIASLFAIYVTTVLKCVPEIGKDWTF